MKKRTIAAMHSLSLSKLKYAVAIVASVCLLTACTSNVPTPNSLERAPEGNITAPRMERVLSDTQKVLQDSVKNSDLEILKSRLTGQALTMRLAEQKIATGSKTAPPEINLSTQIATDSQGETWPRVFFNISKPKDKMTPVVSIFRQDSATQNYHLAYWSSLLPGSKWPSTSRLETGSQIIPDTATGFLKTPKDAVKDYAELINQPDSAVKAAYEDDPFMQYLRNYMKEWTNKVKEVADTGLTASVYDSPIIVIDLGENGALVAAGINYQVQSTVKLEGSSITLNSPVQVLLGAGQESTGRITSNRAVSLLMVIPKANSGEKIRVVGAHVVPIDAKNQSWAEVHPSN